MIIKLYNETTFIYIDKSKYINKKHYYEELIKNKFNKIQLKNNTINEINDKIKKYIKNNV